MKTATYETYAALQRIIETGNLHHFARSNPERLAKFLRRQFRERTDEFITGDPVLSRLNDRRIHFRALAHCLADGGKDLDLWCNLPCKP